MYFTDIDTDDPTDIFEEENSTKVLCTDSNFQTVHVNLLRNLYSQKMDEHVTTSNFDGVLEKCSMLSLNMYMHTTNGKRQRARLCFLNAVEMRTLNFVICLQILRKRNDKKGDRQYITHFLFY